MGILDVSPLCTFITSAEQKDNLIIADSEIEAVSGTIIYTHQPDFPAFRRPIPEVTHTGAFNPCPEAGLSPIIPQILKPFCEDFSLPDFVHNINVDYYLQIVKGIGKPSSNSQFKITTNHANGHERFNESFL
jgi:hypothetical protein